MASDRRGLPHELRVFLTVTLVLTAISGVVVAVARFRGLGYPYSTPLYPGRAIYDFYAFFEAFRLLHSASFFTVPRYPFSYLPNGVPLYRFFYAPGFVRGFLTYIAIILCAGLFALARLYRALRVRGISRAYALGFLAVVFLTSYPAAFCIQRGNLEFILVIFLTLGVWFYCRGDLLACAVLWGVAGSVKLYPLVLLGIFVSARQYRQFFASAGAAIGSTMASLFYIGPTFRGAFNGIRSGLNAFLHLYALRYDPESMGYDHSLFGLLKVCVRPFGCPLEPLLGVYLVTLAAIMLFLYFARVRRLPFSNQLLFLTTASILLPPTSFDYTLLLLYAPFVVLVFVAIDQASSELVPIFALFALLLTPTNFLFWHGVSGTGQIKATLLVVLLFLAAKRPFGGQDWPGTGRERLAQAEVSTEDNLVGHRSEFFGSRRGSF